MSAFNRGGGGGGGGRGGFRGGGSKTPQVHPIVDLPADLKEMFIPRHVVPFVKAVPVKPNLAYTGIASYVNIFEKTRAAADTFPPRKTPEEDAKESLSGL